MHTRPVFYVSSVGIHFTELYLRASPSSAQPGASLSKKTPQNPIAKAGVPLPALHLPTLHSSTKYFTEQHGETPVRLDSDSAGERPGLHKKPHADGWLGLLPKPHQLWGPDLAEVKYIHEKHISLRCNSRFSASVVFGAICPALVIILVQVVLSLGRVQ